MNSKIYLMLASCNSMFFGSYIDFPDAPMFHHLHHRPPGAATGLCAGTVVGAAVGVVPALFTFGLSIPVGAALGGVENGVKFQRFLKKIQQFNESLTKSRKP